MSYLLKFKDFNDSVEQAAYETFIELQEQEINEGSAEGSVDNRVAINAPEGGTALTLLKLKLI